MDVRCRIELLGWLRVEQAGRAITRFRTYKTGALLAYLAFYDRPHPREQLIEMLWPECDPDAGRNSLSKALSSLRNQLEPPGVAAGTVIVADRASVRLNQAVCTTDVAEFEAALRAAEQAAKGGGAGAFPLLSDAVGRYRGELLPGYYEDWNLTERQRLAEAYLQALQRLIRHLEQAGQVRSALDYAHRAVRADPLREESHATLIRLYVAAGEPAAALRQYQELTRILEKDIGSAPSGRVRALVLGLREEEKAPSPLPEAPAEEHAEIRLPYLSLPLGTVTFLLLEAEPGDETIAPLRDVCRRYGGFEAQHGGQSLAAAFGRATDAVACAAAAQRGLSSAPPRVRMALHTGEVPKQEPGVIERPSYNPVLDGAARLLLAAHPGQILCSDATAVLLRRDGEPGLRLADLGVFRLPGADTPERLFEVLYPGRPEQTFPPPNAQPGHNDTLPLSFTRFFGREEERARLAALIQASGEAGAAAPRLITLTGPGGTGKTRLSLEVGRQLLGPFQGAVWFVPLADLFDGRLVIEAIVDALGLPRSPGVEPLRQAVEALARQRTLLVLDNFEQLLKDGDPHAEQGVRTVRTLLERVPSLVILVSSRQRLLLSGEREFPLPPLPTPHGSDAPQHLVRFESVQLFVDRAQAVQPDFQVTPGNADVVAALCERLEGIPLAIELAAARAQVLSPAQMLGQLDNRFDFLVSRQRDAVLRHKTLRAAIDWSYRLLSPELQRFFVRLSVFRGGCTQKAAESVCQEPLALDYLAQLVECSLVLTEGEARTLGAGEVRFRMMETLREYAEEILTPEERAALGRRHAHHFLFLAEAAEAALTGPEQGAWLSRLEEEHDNLRAALEWCKTGEGGGEIGLRLGGALWRFWWIRGHLSEGREQLAELMALPARAQPAGEAGARTAVRAKVYVAAGTLARMQGDYEAARTLFHQGLPLLRELDDKQGIAASLNNLGLIAFEQSDYTAARAHYGRSLALFREMGDKQGIAYALNTLAYLYCDQGDYVQARPLFEESLALRRELGDKQAIASSLNNLGNIPLLLGDFAPARPLFEESLALRRELGDKQGIPLSLTSLGYIALLQGDPAAARPLFEESLALLKELGDKNGTAMALNNLGDVAVLDGAYDQARSLFDESLALLHETGNKQSIAYALEGFARLAAAQGKADQAVRLWAATRVLRESIQSPLPPADQAYYERSMARVRAGLDEASFAAAWAQGSAWTLEEAIAQALEEKGDAAKSWQKKH